MKGSSIVFFLQHLVLVALEHPSHSRSKKSIFSGVRDAPSKTDTRYLVASRRFVRGSQ